MVGTEQDLNCRKGYCDSFTVDFQIKLNKNINLEYNTFSSFRTVLPLKTSVALK